MKLLSDTKNNKKNNTWKPFIWIYKEVTTLQRQLYIWPEMLITTFLSLNKMLSFWFSLFFFLLTMSISREVNYYIQNSLDSYTQQIWNEMAQLTRPQSKHELLYCEDEALVAFSDTLMSLPIHGYSRIKLAWPSFITYKHGKTWYYKYFLLVGK